MILFFISMELVTLIVVCLIRGSESANLRFVQGNNYYAGRGRGMGRPQLYVDPSDIDPSWWQQPPPVGPDPFMQGFSQRVYPRYPGGLGHDITGTGMHHTFPRRYNQGLSLWGGIYNPNSLNRQHPYDEPQWRDWAFSKRPKGSSYSAKKEPRYYTPRDSFGLPPSKMKTFITKDRASPPRDDPVKDWYMPAVVDEPSPFAAGSEGGESEES